MTLKIYHNPRCSKSRQTLALIQAQGVEPEIIDYLKTPLSRTELNEILQLLKITPRELMRSQEAEYKTLGLNDPALSDDALCIAMLNHSKLIERPIVIKDLQAIIGRPPENVLSLLNNV